MKKFYTLIDHTADICIKVKGKTLEDLFSNAGAAVFDIIAERQKESNKAELKKFVIEQEADNLDDLFINWLNELLSLSAAREVIFTEFKFNTLHDTFLSAVAFGEDSGDFKINTEIKAATYHELLIKKSAGGYSAQVILDV